MRRALVVGFDNYRNAKLKGCINDAQNIANELDRNSDDSKNFDVKLITDKDHEVTKGYLRKEIETLFSGRCETALLYFSGHGVVNSSGGYIVTPDWSYGDEGIPMDTILKLANGSKATNKIIILDCCNSGAMGNVSLMENNISQIAEGVTILTASRDDESAVESNGAGVFTSLFLEGLRGAATDLMGNVTLANLYSYVDSALGAWGQRPIFKTNVSRFSPIRKVKAPIDPKILRKTCVYFKKIDDEFKLDPSYEYTEDTADEDNVKKFKELQKLQSVGLVVPCNAEFMYYAAINSKSCKLTSLGHRYWRLAKEGKI